MGFVLILTTVGRCLMLVVVILFVAHAGQVCCSTESLCQENKTLLPPFLIFGIKIPSASWHVWTM